MAPEDVKKTAVTTPFGLFEWSKMPFGLKNEAQTFQSFMDLTFGDLEYTFVYMDDVLFASTTEQEHKAHVHEVLERLNKN